ncbi:MAG: hypothetical protein LHV68_03830 [Elusimicrobia bacterium]|nr:hypothetical protein [Candidatus Liberimonas magnetica]
MSGKIKKLIDEIVKKRARGIETIMVTTRTKLFMKGINVDTYTDTSEDNVEVVDKLHKIAEEMGVQL